MKIYKKLHAIRFTEDWIIYDLDVYKLGEISLNVKAFLKDVNGYCNGDIDKVMKCNGLFTNKNDAIRNADYIIGGNGEYEEPSQLPNKVIDYFTPPYFEVIKDKTGKYIEA